MATIHLVKSEDFEIVSRFATLDQRNRISIGSLTSAAETYNVYENAAGQIVLDPVKSISTSEVWLWEKQDTLSSVKRGMKQIAEGNSHDLGSFAAHAEEA
jgi:hypothetical protein